MEMKKTKKLSLSRETLRNLDEREMRAVAGGVTLSMICQTLGTGACTLCTRACSVCCP
jgi:natural product precursor